MSEIIFYLNKSFAIIYIGLLYFILGISGSYIIEKSQSNIKDEEKSKIMIIIEILINVSLLVVMAYLIRKIVKKIPYPFDNIAGFEYNKLKEFKGGIIIAWSIFSVQKKMAKRIQDILNI